jgi:hypothetical protein
MSIVNQSNKNSALIATVEAASDALQNPFEYSVSNITPFHAPQWVETPSDSGTAAGRSSTFPISKFGYARSATLSWTTTVGQVNGTSDITDGALHIPTTGFLGCIDSIELFSTSRKLATLSREALMCCIADAHLELRRAYEQGLHMMSSGQPGDAANRNTGGEYHCVMGIPLSFFTQSKTALAATFTEPLSIRVNWGSCRFGYGTHGTGESAVSGVPHHSISDSRVLFEFRQLTAEAEDSVIESNYSDTLSQIVSDYVTEKTATFVASATPQKVTLKLSTNAVVQDLYIMVSTDEDQAEAANQTNASLNLQEYRVPLNIKKMSVTCSGTSILPLVDSRYMRLFGRREEDHGDIYRANAGGSLEASSLTHIIRVPMGNGCDKTRVLGGVSFRELHNSEVTVEFDTGALTGIVGANCRMTVVARTMGLVSTDSSSGRMELLLSN